MVRVNRKNGFPFPLQGAWIVLVVMLATGPASAPPQQAGQNREAVLTAARELMAAAHYCALITVDSTGQPHARTMDPFPPDTNMVVWLATNPRSRKVREIRQHPQVTLYYPAPEGKGYVSIAGRARLVDDPAEKRKRWKPGWEVFYPDRDDSYLLIAVQPLSLELVSYPHQLLGNSVTWQAPLLRFADPDSISQSTPLPKP